MAGFGFTNDASAKLFEAISKDIFVITCTKSNITTAELQTMVEGAQATSTVIGIKCATAFESGTTDAVHMILEGTDIADDASDALGVTGNALTHHADMVF